MNMIFLAREDMVEDQFNTVVSQLFEDMTMEELDAVDMIELHVTHVSKDHGPVREVSA